MVIFYNFEQNLNKLILGTFLKSNLISFRNKFFYIETRTQIITFEFQRHRTYLFAHFFALQNSGEAEWLKSVTNSLIEFTHKLDPVKINKFILKTFNLLSKKVHITNANVKYAKKQIILPS